MSTSSSFAVPNAPSRDSVEDDIYHNGQFYSLTYSGVVEAWSHSAGSDEFTNSVINAGPIRTAKKDKKHHLYRKYLAAALDGRLIVVLRYKNRGEGDEVCDYWRGRLARTSFFKVQVLVNDDAGGRHWKDTTGIGNAALFVSINGSLCLSTREHPELRAGYVYFTNDDLQEIWLHKEMARDVRVYSLEDGTVEPIEAMGPSWPEAAWFMPSFA